jgi:hypothetical protein
MLDTILNILAWIAFALGAFLCILNFHLSFTRYAWHRLRGLPRESYKHISGFPIFGSLFVALSLLKFHNIIAMVIAGIVLILIDTGGLHWFIGVMLYHAVSSKRKIDP